MIIVLICSSGSNLKRYRKTITTAVLYEDENLLQYTFYRLWSYHGNVMTPLGILLILVFLGTRTFSWKSPEGACTSLHCLNSPVSNLSRPIKHGLIKNGLIKHGLIKHGLIKHGSIKHGLIKHGLIKYGLIKHGLIKHGLIKHRSIKHGLIKPGLIKHRLIKNMDE